MSTHTATIQALQYQVELLTPVHIGSGDVYVKGLEYFPPSRGDSGSQIKVLPKNWLTRIEKDLDISAINDLADRIDAGEVQAWLSKTGQMKNLPIHSLSLNHSEPPPREVRQQIRDGMGNPLLPGSSLKGAMRTSIVYALLQSDPNLQQSLERIQDQYRRERPRRTQYADQKLMSEILGRNPNYDLMRALRVGDVLTEPPFQCGLHKVQTLTLSNATHFKEKFLNVVEGLNSGHVGLGLLSFDQYLLHKAATKAREGFTFPSEFDQDFLLRALNQTSRDLLQSELAFLEDKQGQHIEQLKNEYLQLQRELENLDQNEALFNCGWGTGWLGMTGPLMDNDDLQKENHALRKALQLAANKDRDTGKFRYLQFPFPKSRRVALTNGSAAPLGWIKIRVQSMEAVREQQRVEADKRHQEQLRLKAEKKAQEEWEALPAEERLVRELESDQLDQTAIGQRFEEILALEGEYLTRAAEQLKRLWKEWGQWNVKPKKQKQYKKVQRVKKILGED